MAEEKILNLRVESSGLRLDKFVAEICPDMSRTRIQKLIESGYITINRESVKSGRRLKKGEMIQVIIPPPTPSSISAEEIPLAILYEDKDLMVIDKPAGMTVHPGAGQHTHTLANAILAHVPEINIEDTERPGIVHRLDKNTSGLIIAAKNPISHMKLSDQFKNRQVAKVYITLVKGHLTPESGTIEANIGRDPRHRQRMAVVRNGRSATTNYKVIEYFGDYTLLEIRPRTGRTHQIRVHLSAIGYPIVGDEVYGGRSDLIERQFLHASELEFNLPSTGERKHFISPLPEDLRNVLNRLGTY